MAGGTPELSLGGEDRALVGDVDEGRSLLLGLAIGGRRRKDQRRATRWEPSIERGFGVQRM